MKSSKKIDTFQIANSKKIALPPTFQILGIRISTFQIPNLVDYLIAGIRAQSPCQFIIYAGIPAIVDAQSNQIFKKALNTGISVCDGKPLVLIGRWLNYPLQRRVYGPEVLETFCEKTGSQFRHFFYGGESGVAEALGEKLRKKFGIQIAGTFTPPFRTLTEKEEAEIVSILNSSNADIVWVGIGAPKQDIWMYRMHQKLNAPFLCGVGAAFDFISEKKIRPPAWIGDYGLEWLFRLMTEPRRLWKRYLLGGIKFIFFIIRAYFKKGNLE